MEIRKISSSTHRSRSRSLGTLRNQDGTPRVMSIKKRCYILPTNLAIVPSHFFLFLSVKTIMKLNFGQGETFGIEIKNWPSWFTFSGHAEFGHFTLLLFCRGRQRNVPRIITHVHSHYSSCSSELISPSRRILQIVNNLRPGVLFFHPCPFAKKKKNHAWWQVRSSTNRRARFTNGDTKDVPVNFVWSSVVRKQP